MKRLFLCVFALVIWLSSCTSSAGIIYDETIPIEQSSWLSLNNLGTVVGYNGISVNWKISGFRTVQMPAGKTLLEVDVYSQLGNTIYTGKGMLIQYYFEPGKHYFFAIGRDKESDALGLRVYVYDIGEKFGIGMEQYEAHFVEFIYFLNADNGGRTVLN
jgi:hypothetical protein